MCVCVYSDIMDLLNIFFDWLLKSGKSIVKFCNIFCYFPLFGLGRSIAESCPLIPCTPWTWSASWPGCGTPVTRSWSRTASIANGSLPRKACWSVETTVLRLGRWQTPSRQRPPQAWNIPGQFTRCKMDFRGSHSWRKVTSCTIITDWWLEAEESPTQLVLIFVHSSSVFEVPVEMDAQWCFLNHSYMIFCCRVCLFFCKYLYIPFIAI